MSYFKCDRCGKRVGEDRMEGGPDQCSDAACRAKGKKAFWDEVDRCTEEVKSWPYWKRNAPKPETPMEWVREYQAQLIGARKRVEEIEAELEKAWAKFRKEAAEVNELAAKEREEREKFEEQYERD